MGDIRAWVHAHFLTFTILSLLGIVYIMQYHVLPEFGSQAISNWAFHYSVDTTQPFDIVSYITAAVSHVSAFHLFRNAVMIAIAGWILARAIPQRIVGTVFLASVIAGPAAFAVTGHIDGVSRTAVGSSGGAYALLAFSGLVVPRVEMWLRSTHVSIPLWVFPLGLPVLELGRVWFGGPLSASPYSHYAHMVGVAVAAIAWFMLGCPRKTRRGRTI